MFMLETLPSNVDEVEWLEPEKLVNGQKYTGIPSNHSCSSAYQNLDLIQEPQTAPIFIIRSSHTETICLFVGNMNHPCEGSYFVTGCISL